MYKSKKNNLHFLIYPSLRKTITPLCVGLISLLFLGCGVDNDWRPTSETFNRSIGPNPGEFTRTGAEPGIVNLHTYNAIFSVPSNAQIFLLHEYDPNTDYGELYLGFANQTSVPEFSANFLQMAEMSSFTIELANTQLDERFNEIATFVEDESFEALLVNSEDFDSVDSNPGFYREFIIQTDSQTVDAFAFEILSKAYEPAKNAAEQIDFASNPSGSEAFTEFRVGISLYTSLEDVSIFVVSIIPNVLTNKYELETNILHDRSLVTLFP